MGIGFKWGHSLSASTRANLTGQFLCVNSVAIIPKEFLDSMNSAQIWSRTLRPLVLPGGVLLLCAVVLGHSAWFTLPLPALSFLRYCALAGGMLLAWRFHSSRIFLALLIMLLAQQAISPGGNVSIGTPGWTLLKSVALLVPLNFVLIALLHERGFSVSSLAPMGLLLFVQSMIVAVLCAAPSAPVPSPHPHALVAKAALPGSTLFVFAAVCVFLAARLFFTSKPVDSALLWSLSAFFFAAQSIASARLWSLYSTAAACILAVSIIENSYLLAYHDELTTLPSRRAFNDALMRLQEPFSIAVVDIDHFKRFNDTYGHDIGDQVLRLVASNLTRMTGGGEAYRCGGEEFMILFPGKTMPDVIDHLERLRAAIEASEFRMRREDRRQVPRGPDRRNQRMARPRKGHAIRQLAQGKSPTFLSVTVSIGVATSTKQNPQPDLILQAADKALYRAKDNGRNRVETASAPRRSRAQSAGIA
jgi:diguanylate cyclase (GGDEF)-like protein